MPGVPTSEPTPVERRRHPRYPVHLGVQYKILYVGRVNHTGSGRTVDMSSGGIRFEVDRQIATRSEVILEISWPVLLEGKHDLKLVAYGRVVRSSDTEVAVMMRSCEFRLKGSKKLLIISRG